MTSKPKDKLYNSEEIQLKKTFSYAGGVVPLVPPPKIKATHKPDNYDRRKWHRKCVCPVSRHAEKNGKKKLVFWKLKLTKQRHFCDACTCRSDLHSSVFFPIDVNTGSVSVRLPGMLEKMISSKLLNQI